MGVERIEINSADIVLKGRLYEPDDLSKCKGIIIFTHGLGYCSRQYKISGNFFSEKNYVILTYDLRAHASTQGRWTLDNSVNDLIRIVDFLQQRYFFENRNKICVMGHSTGALISLLAAYKDQRISCASVVTVVTCLADSYKFWFKSGYNVDVKCFFKSKGVIPDIIDKFMDDSEMLNRYRRGELSKSVLNIPHRYGMLKSESWDDFFFEISNSVDVIRLANKIHFPILLFRGTSDEVMDPEKTNELFDAVKKNNPETQLIITQSKDHFQNDSWDLIQKETAFFIERIFECDNQAVRKHA